jgi:hypothetical protein
VIDHCLKWGRSKGSRLQGSDPGHPLLEGSAVVRNKQHEDQWDRIQDPDMNPHSYVHLFFFDKGVKNIQWKKDLLNLINFSK